MGIFVTTASSATSPVTLSEFLWRLNISFGTSTLICNRRNSREIKQRCIALLSLRIVFYNDVNTANPTVPGFNCFSFEIVHLIRICYDCETQLNASVIISQRAQHRWFRNTCTINQTHIQRANLSAAKVQFQTFCYLFNWWERALGHTRRCAIFHVRLVRWSCPNYAIYLQIARRQIVRTTSRATAADNLQIWV